MSARFTLQKPYVVASLPQPVDKSYGGYFVSEVFGGTPGQKKRKRSELAVGIDGEGVNIYDILTSRLITSYALPPQSCFSCPPSSLRTRISKTKVERRTYVSTSGPNAQLKLFHECSESTVEIFTREASQNVRESSSPIVFLGTLTAPQANEFSGTISDLVAIKEDGEIQCYDGEELHQKWTSPASALFRDFKSKPQDAKVEFAHITNVYTAIQGILKGRQDILTMFPQEITEDGFNPEILVSITRSDKQATRILHIMSFPRRSIAASSWSANSLLTVEIPYELRKGSAFFSVHPSAGTLNQLENGMLTVFDLTENLPKKLYKFRSAGAQSFLRLSNTSIMVSSSNTITVYNPKYQSRLASVTVDLSESSKQKRSSNGSIDVNTNYNCKFISYFPKLALAMAVVDNNLVGVQVDGHQDCYGRHRVAGLLIDSLGCSASDQVRRALDENPSMKKIKTFNLQTLDPIKVAGSSPQPWSRSLEPIEKSFAERSCTEEIFDRLMAPYLPHNRSEISLTSINEISKRPVFEQTKSNKQTLDIDRRWVVYALSKIFTMSQNENNELRLSITFYAPNTFLWLLKYGYMTIANIESGLRSSGGVYAKAVPPGDLTRIVVELDPEMELLRALIAHNYLGAAELLHAIRELMESLGILGKNPNTKQGLLRSEEDAEDTITQEGDIEEHIQKLEAEAEHDIDLAEHQLGVSSGTRGEVISLALAKLYTCSEEAIVYALQTTYNPQEIVCLITILRFELARGAWTSRYLDADEVEQISDEDSGIPDNPIILIASLLNCCIDAVGAGGWLSGEARLVDGDPFEAEELISSLKIEVSAALEGIEEMIYLRGLVAEMVRYGEAIQKPLREAKSSNSQKPIAFPREKETSILPLGLRAEKQISLLKVGLGGDVTGRSMRDVGDQKSRKVGKYSRERIDI